MRFLTSFSTTFSALNYAQNWKLSRGIAQKNYEFEVGYTHETSNCHMSNTFTPLLALSTMSLPSVQIVTKEDEVGMEVD